MFTKQSFLMRFCTWGHQPKNIAPVLPYELIDRTTPRNRMKLSLGEIFKKIYDLYRYMTWKVDGTVPASYVFMKSPLPKVPNLKNLGIYNFAMKKPIIFQSFTGCNKISPSQKQKGIIDTPLKANIGKSAFSIGNSHLHS